MIIALLLIFYIPIILSFICYVFLGRKGKEKRLDWKDEVHPMFGSTFANERKELW